MTSNPSALELKAIFSMTQLGVAQADATTRRIVRVNEAFCRITGYSESELLELTVEEINHPEDREMDRSMLTRVLRGESPDYQIEKRYIRKDGSVVWVSANGNVIRGEKGEFVRTLVLVQDISARKAVEQELKESQARERAYLENLPVGVWFLNGKGEIVYANPAGQKIWGGARYVGCDEFHEYKGWKHGTEEKFSAQDWAAARAVQKGETTLEEAIDIECFDGTQKTILNSAVPVKNSDGSLLGAVVFNQDITRRIQSEKAVRLSESRFRLLVDQLPFSLQIISPEGRIVRVNRAWEKLWGVSLEMLAEYNILEDEQLVEKGIMPYIKRAYLGEAVEIPPVSYIPDRGIYQGQERWTRGITYPVRTEEGELREVILIHEDITAQKRAEAALRESEERLRMATEASQLIIWDMDLKRRHVKCSANAMQIWGFCEGPAEAFFEKVHEGERQMLRDRARLAIKGTRDYTLEYRVIDLQGEVHWLHSRGDVFFDSNGNAARFVGVSVEITERRRTEQAVRESEERLRLATQTGKVGVWEWDITSNKVTWTDSLYALHGVSREGFDSTVEGFARLVHPDDREMVNKALEKSLSERAPYEITFRAVKPNGDIVWVFTNALLIREEGKALRMLGATTDVSEVKRAEEALRSSAERLSLALAAGELGDWSWDAKNDQSIFSARAAEIFGVSSSPNLPWSEMQMLIHPEDRQRVSELMQQCVANNSRYETTYRVNRSDGSQVWVAEFGMATKSPKGESTGVLGIVQDITERKTIELALAEAQEALKEHAAQLEQTVADRTTRLRDTIAELEHFSYTITHDMRAPLRAMQAFGQILREEYSSKFDEMGSDYLRRIVEAANRMDNLITDSLSYAKAMQSEFVLDPIDVSKIIQGIIESYPQFQKPHAEVEITPNIPWVCANSAGLTQCFSNLLANAVKFVEHGKTPLVKVWAERKGGKVRIWVEDNGIGIPDDQRDRVFIMFQRMTKKYEGTGVGLALVRKVVEKMRGKVGFESEPGKGSKFWVEFEAAIHQKEKPVSYGI